MMEATPLPSFQCGLCKTNDNAITLPQCFTKHAATKKARRHRGRQSAKPPLQEAKPTGHFQLLGSSSFNG